MDSDVSHIPWNIFHLHPPMINEVIWHGSMGGGLVVVGQLHGLSVVLTNTSRALKLFYYCFLSEANTSHRVPLVFLCYQALQGEIYEKE